MGVRLVAVVACLACAGAAARPAAADDDHEKALETFQAARAAIAAGDCVSALPKLEESLAYEPSVGAHLSIADCYEQVDLVAGRRVSRTELPRLIKFAVVREIGLRHDAENLPAMNDDRAVVQMMIDLERRPDHADDGQLGRRLDHRGNRIEACVEQRPLLKQVVARIRREPQLRKKCDHRLALGRLANQRDGLFGVVSWVRHANRRHTNRDSHEIVIVEIKEVAVSDHVSLSQRHLSKTVPIVCGPYKIASTG